ncbi:MAG: hypothetical protein ACLTLQ_09720 [[Clostridium] scindens]
MVCAVTGLDHTYPGQGLGYESASDMPVLEPRIDVSDAYCRKMPMYRPASEF